MHTRALPSSLHKFPPPHRTAMEETADVNGWGARWEDRACGCDLVAGCLSLSDRASHCLSFSRRPTVQRWNESCITSARDNRDSVGTTWSARAPTMFFTSARDNRDSVGQCRNYVVSKSSYDVLYQCTWQQGQCRNYVVSKSSYDVLYQCTWQQGQCRNSTLRGQQKRLRRSLPARDNRGRVDITRSAKAPTVFFTIERDNSDSSVTT